MTPAAADILVHALGLSHERDVHEPTRNHYVSDAPDEDLLGLVKAGLMQEAPKPPWCMGRVFIVTDTGRDVAMAEHKARCPKLTRGQARYRRWLGISDAWDTSFGDWLKRGCP